jgi:hypothetical protein
VTALSRDSVGHLGHLSEQVRDLASIADVVDQARDNISRVPEIIEAAGRTKLDFVDQQGLDARCERRCTDARAMLLRTLGIRNDARHLID